MGFIEKLINKKTVPSKKAEPGRADHKSKYRGVQVSPRGQDCCQVVLATMESRYLSSEVPKLPLDGCDAINCQCTYELFDDRRTDYRRAADVVLDIVSQMCRSDNRDADSAGRRNED